MIVLKLFIISYVLKDLAEFLAELIDMFTITKKKSLGVIKSLLVYLLSCNKCFTFWFSLIMTGDLFIASIIALLMMLQKKLIDIWTKETEMK